MHIEEQSLTSECLILVWEKYVESNIKAKIFILYLILNPFRLEQMFQVAEKIQKEVGTHSPEQ